MRRGLRPKTKRDSILSGIAPGNLDRWMKFQRHLSKNKERRNLRRSLFFISLARLGRGLFEMRQHLGQDALLRLRADDALHDLAALEEHQGGDAHDGVSRKRKRACGPCC